MDHNNSSICFSSFDRNPEKIPVGADSMNLFLDISLQKYKPHRRYHLWVQQRLADTTATPTDPASVTASASVARRWRR